MRFPRVSGEVISFCRHFPKDKDKHLKDAFPIVESALEDYNILCTLNLEQEVSMTISADKWTVHPHLFIKARIVLFLLAQSVPAPEAICVIDQRPYEIINIGTQAGGLCSLLGIHTDQFPECKQLLLGPDGSHLKRLREKTDCSIFVDNDIVFALGSFDRLRTARMIVEDCFAHKLSVGSLINKVTKDGVFASSGAAVGGGTSALKQQVKSLPGTKIKKTVRQKGAIGKVKKR